VKNQFQILPFKCNLQRYSARQHRPPGGGGGRDASHRPQPPRAQDVDRRRAPGLRRHGAGGVGGDGALRGNVRASERRERGGALQVESS
jgi:hypothetical protein